MAFWTAEGFERGAQVLCQVLKKEVSASSDLLEWFLETTRDGTSYLVHPPIKTRHRETLAGADSCGHGEDIVDESLTIDPDAALSAAFGELEWQISIAFSETWQVPVVYFTVHQNGYLCTRDQVMVLLEQQNQNAQVHDSWDFVSYDEHPTMGIPALFLHPCQTRERLQLLDAQTTTTSSVRLWSWMSLIFPSLGFAVLAMTYQTVRKRLVAEDIESGP
jgi:hypothetical protein